MFASFRFAARRAAAAARPRRIRTPTPLPAGFVNSQTAITDEALLDIAIKDLVNNGFFQTDHLLASVCDDPENFFLMFRTLNNGFDFQTKSNFKKLYTGPAWHAAIHFVRKALIMHRRYYSAQ